MEELLKKLKGVPVVGALFKGADGGSTSSEFGLLAGLIGVATAHASTMTYPLAIAIAGLGIGVGMFAQSRGRVKGEGAAKEPPVAKPAKTPVAAVAALLLLLIPVFLLTGCAAAGAGTDAGLQTHSFAGGAVAAQNVGDIQVTVQTWPEGMGTWTPEQLSAFVAARAAVGGGVGEVLAVRQEVKIGSDQQGGQGGTATNSTPVQASLSPAGAPGTAAAVGRALGVGGAPGPAGGPVVKPEPPPPPPPGDGGK